jgi:5-methylcytosine-specific restriction endonuclease McrA
MPRWTPEARERQRQPIVTWQPWSKSTGPKTSRGKRRSAANWKKDSRGQFLQIVRTFRSIVRGE